MKKGDIVVCIDVRGFNSGIFTLGKSYIIQNHRQINSTSYIKIMGDSNCTYEVLGNRFIMLSEYRKDKIENLLDIL